MASCANKPKPTPEHNIFWDGTQAGELRLQRCTPALFFRRARPAPAFAQIFCKIFKASGKGKL